MGGANGGGGMGTLQALLTELSGLKKPRGLVNRYVRRALGMRPKPPPKYRILVMMASNMPESLDPALLRPGRIDRICKVGYPSRPAGSAPTSAWWPASRPRTSSPGGAANARPTSWSRWPHWPASGSTGKRLEVGSPGGGAKRGGNPEADLRRALADRIEDNLTTLLSRTEEVLRENRNHILALAHALESHKTLSGEDVKAVLEHTAGPVVDGRPYADPDFLAELEAYHQSAAVAHRDHSRTQLTLPVPAALSPLVDSEA
jgi:ATPase family associated with various cellular activities (AAA)